MTTIVEVIDNRRYFIGPYGTNVISSAIEDDEDVEVITFQEFLNRRLLDRLDRCR